MIIKISLALGSLLALWRIQEAVVLVDSLSLPVRKRGSITTPPSQRDSSVRSLSAHNRLSDLSRRYVLSSSIAGLSSALALLLTTATPEPALAEDEIFRPNPLTNPFLEQVRIWEQAEANKSRYGGELERGDAGNKGKIEAYPKLLVPILQISDELQTVNRLVRDGVDTSNWREAQRILAKAKYQKIPFKKMFNAYSDNIYYADPDRANLYLGGGATPKTEQSLAYLLRNDILTNVEALQAELDYLLAKNDEESPDDLRLYASMATTAMTNYLDLVPPRELARAREILLQAS